jgi:hypothetical protein
MKIRVSISSATTTASFSLGVIPVLPDFLIGWTAKSFAILYKFGGQGAFSGCKNNSIKWGKSFTPVFGAGKGLFSAIVLGRPDI